MVSISNRPPCHVSVEATRPQTSTKQYIVLPEKKTYSHPSEARRVEREQKKKADAKAEAEAKAQAEAEAKAKKLRRQQRWNSFRRCVILMLLVVGLPIGFVWHVQADESVGRDLAQTVQNWTSVVDMPENVQQWVCSGVLPAPNITSGQPVPPGPIGACMVCRIHQLFDGFYGYTRPYAFAGSKFFTFFLDIEFAACVRHFRYETLAKGMCTDISTMDLCMARVAECVYTVLPFNRISESDCMMQVRQCHKEADEEAEAEAQAKAEAEAQAEAEAEAQAEQAEAEAQAEQAEAQAQADQKSLISTVFSGVVGACCSVLAVMATLRQP